MRIFTITGSSPAASMNTNKYMAFAQNDNKRRKVSQCNTLWNYGNMRLGACSCLPSEEPASASACPCFGCSWSFSRPDFQVQVGVREKEKDMLGISEGSSQRREQSGVCDESQISWVGCLQTPRRSLFLLTHNAASDICTLWFQRVCACLHTSVLKHWQRLTVIYEMRLQLLPQVLTVFFWNLWGNNDDALFFISLTRRRRNEDDH